MSFILRLIQWPSRAGWLFLVTVLAVLSLATIGLAGPPAEEESEFGAAEFEAYIHRFVGQAPQWKPNKRVAERAPIIAELAVESAEQHGIDPRVTAVIMRTESGFRESIPGKTDNDDWGIMQINRRSWKHTVRDLDLSKTEDQIEAGHRVLAYGYARCDGSDEQALTYYSSGQCEVSAKHPKYRNLMYRIVLLSRLARPR